VYVNNVDDSTVAVIDGADGRLLATLPVGAGSTVGTISTLYHRYYLPNSADGTVSIIDTDADVLLRTIAVGDAPQQVAIDDAASRMYVANLQDDEIAMFDVEGEALTARAPAGSNPTRIIAGSGHLLVLNETDGSPAGVTLIDAPRLSDPTSIVTEYASPTSGDFFHSADGIENRLLADGLFGETWRKTLQFWRVWDSPGVGRQAMCRFASSDEQAIGTHFYTAAVDECDALKSDPRWLYEGEAYYVAMPDASGRCPDGTESLYRLYDDTRGAPFHRYTTDASIKAGMKNGGWKAEGAGADGVFACVPPLASAAAASAPALIADDGSLVAANPFGTRHVTLPPRGLPFTRQP